MKADYRSIEKEVNKIIEKRGKEKARVEKELSEQNQALEKARAEKERILATGTKEEYLKACEVETREEASLRYLEEKKKYLVNSYKVSIEDLERVYRTIKQEQDRVTIEALKVIIEKTKELEELRKEVMGEQEKGTSLYRSLLSVFKEDMAPGENILEGRPSLAGKPYSCIYGINFIYQLERQISDLEKALNSTGIKTFIGK